MRRLVALLAALAALAALALALPAGSLAAGMTTHAFMAERAIAHVETPELRALLGLHRQHLLSGAAFPDSGYAPGTGFGETAHWERFVNAYVERLRAHARPLAQGGRGCALADPLGACAPLVAHLMGTAAHGMGDETWDWLFEPRTRDHGEAPANPCFNDHGHTHPEHCPVNAAALDGTPPDELSSSIEYAMDIVAIADHERLLGNSPVPPPLDDVLAAFAAVGERSGTLERLAAGHAFVTAALSGERAVSPVESRRIREQMPWSSAHFVTEAGGVDWSARAIAGYYEALWRKLKGESPAPRVVAEHPRRGARDVPVSWPAATTSPGPHTGGGERRIVAVLSNAVFPESVTPQTFLLLDGDGAPVPPLAGFPRPGPYHASEGTHSIMFYPARDLEPCTRHTAVLTTGIRDWRGTGGPENALRHEHRWSFRTEAAGGGRCTGQN